MATLLKEIEFEDAITSAIKQFGTPASLLLLCAPALTFQVPDIDGMIGYQLIGNTAIVIGDPLCAPEDIQSLKSAFLAHQQKLGHSVVYLLASDPFGKTQIQAAEELVMDPTKFQMRQKLRWKIHQAEQHGVMIKEYEPKMEEALKDTMQKWQKGRHGPQIYLGTLDFFENYGGRRIFVAELEGRIIGFVTILYLPSKEGWVVTSLLALPKSPVGVTEALMNRVITSLTEENCRFLCLGFVAAQKVGEITGFSSLSKWLIKGAYQLARKLFHLDAKRTYFNKYHPSCQPTYIQCSGSLGIKELLAIKTTLNVKI